MRLSEVMPGGGDGGDPEIAEIAFDHRAVRPGTLFFCVVGRSHDGHRLAPAAVARGAAALVVERPLGLGVPEVCVPSVRAAMPGAAARFFGDPSARLDVIGITGTNGKTTSAFVARALLEAAGRPCGMLGTITRVIGGRERPVVHTTPEAIDLQRDLRAMLDAGDLACAMEVSSHALALGRADAVRWAAAIFTNLTQDHLDFHGDMEAYFAAKRALFAAGPRVAVVNVDDGWGRRLAGELGSRAVTVAIDRPADYRAHEVETGPAGSRFALRTSGGEAAALATPLPGRFNVLNALGVVAALHRLGLPLATLAAALPRAGTVPGRLEPVDAGQPFSVLVDYSHTPDSLDAALRAARELAGGRVIVVFGAGGDRDRGKRPLMGAVARRRADRVIVTSDNPRSEDPEAIIHEILAGAGEQTEWTVDRAAAIRAALHAAEPGDVVLIAGKGHERRQELAGGRTIPFDDAAVARRALAEVLTP